MRVLAERPNKPFFITVKELLAKLKNNNSQGILVWTRPENSMSYILHSTRYYVRDYNNKNYNWIVIDKMSGIADIEDSYTFAELSELIPERANELQWFNSIEAFAEELVGKNNW